MYVFYFEKVQSSKSVFVQHLIISNYDMISLHSKIHSFYDADTKLSQASVLQISKKITFLHTKKFSFFNNFVNLYLS
jgi:hypothetical protein